MKAVTVVVLLLLTSGCAARIATQVEIPRRNLGSPEVMRFVVHPRVVHPGQAAMLHWDARNASEVLLEEAADPHADIKAEFRSLGTFPASGTLEVRPQVTTIYMVSCGDETIGCSSASVRVIVR